MTDFFSDNIDVKKLSYNELNELANSLRKRIISVTQKNGGHLASNLGAVELTIALHKVLDLDKDYIVWDVGHQCYAHKLLTGRGELMENLRHDGGASGFPSPVESPSDPFITGHSGNSLSLALGLARANELLSGDRHVVAVVGDGAFTSGEIYEALNDLGERKAKLTIILNDNGMSISPNVGAISRYFNKLRINKDFVKYKTRLKSGVLGLPFVGKTIFSGMRAIKNAIKKRYYGNSFFDKFGIRYYGPYDGHDIKTISGALSVVKAESPAIIHLLTQKGKGVLAAQLRPDIFHGVSSDCNEEKSFSLVAGETLCSLAAEYDNLVAVTAAMTDGTGLGAFAKEYPDRFFDVAIAEQHAVSLCAGFAKGGVKPFFCVYSTFLQRAFDQVLHDVCINDLPVVFLIDRAGMVGADGVTHQGVFDFSYLSLMPNMTIGTPCDGSELTEMIKFAYSYDKPIAIRYPKSYVRELQKCDKIDSTEWKVLKDEKSPITILATGKTVEIALGVEGANVVNARFIKPLDVKFLNKIKGTIVTVEDNVLLGGFGYSVSAYFGGSKRVLAIGHKDEFSDERNCSFALEKSGITKKNIQNIVNAELKRLEKQFEI